MSQTHLCRSCGLPNGKKRNGTPCDDCQRALNARYSRESYERSKALKALDLSTLWLRRPLVAA